MANFEKPSYLEQLGPMGYDEPPEDLQFIVEDITKVVKLAIDYLQMVATHTDPEDIRTVEIATDLVEQDLEPLFKKGDGVQGPKLPIVNDLISLTEQLKYGDR